MLNLHTSSLSIDYESIAKNYQHGDWIFHLAWDMNNRKRKAHTNAMLWAVRTF